MEGKILFHLKAFIPGFKPIPQIEEAENWGESYYDNIKKTTDALLNDPEAFGKKMAKPILDTARRMLSDDFVSKKGLTKEQIITALQKKLNDPATAEKYRQGIKQMAQKVKDDLPQMKERRARGMTFSAKGEDAIKLVENWLTGNPKSKRLLSKHDEVLSGEPMLICQPAKQGKFKSKLHNQLMRSVKNISDLGYDPKFRKRENDKINRLVNNYLRKDIIPFSTGGTSHIDFVVIPESVTPADSREVKEIQYKIYSSFMGEVKAQKLRAESEEKDYPTPPDPDDYLGKPGKKAYFDMYLDISVAVPVEYCQLPL